MNMQYQAIVHQLSKLPKFSDYITLYSSGNKGEKLIIDLIEGYKKYREKELLPLSKEEDEFLRIMQDTMMELAYTHNHNGISFISETRDNDKDIIDNFRKDWEKAKTERFSFIDRDRQTYKTYKEYFLLYEYSDNGLIDKYQDSDHPLINQIIGSSLIHGGFIRRGVPMLYKSVLKANNPINPYWHSMYGVFGCTYSLWEFIRLYGLRKFMITYSEYYKHLIELLYLYLSRSIIISEIEGAAQGHDFYRNRADLQRDNYSICMALFMDCRFIANMDIQYMSDCYRAFMLCLRLGVPQLAEQAFKDAYKMYRYSSLNYFNEDNGIREIEDATFSELVDRGTERARVVAENILGRYKIGEIRIPDYVFDEMFVDILNRNDDKQAQYKWYDKT